MTAATFAGKEDAVKARDVTVMYYKERGREYLYDTELLAKNRCRLTTHIAQKSIWK